MNFKHILFPIISLFLVYQSAKLLGILLSPHSPAIGVGVSILFAFLLALFITGVAAFPGFVFPTSHLLPQKYYHIHRPSRLHGWYIALGVGYFRVLLLGAFWGRAMNRKKYYDGTRNGLRNFIYQSHQSEFGHLIPFVALLIISAILPIYGHWSVACTLIVINIIGNLYPIILQRHHRVRIAKILG